MVRKGGLPLPPADSLPFLGRFPMSLEPADLRVIIRARNDVEAHVSIFPQGKLLQGRALLFFI